MAEKRKPALTLLLRKPGNLNKPYKIELFPCQLWEKPEEKTLGKQCPKAQFRLRVNGKWFGKGREYYSVKGFTKILEQSIEALL